MEYLAGTYDLVVVGAGHAGVEAALAAARLGVRTLLLTLSLDHIALMPCNPSLGGPAKGHLLREIDALGGQMGINADASQIQMRLLNTSKGPAVQALRAQIDKRRYQENMAWVVENQAHLDVKQGTVCRILCDGGRVGGVLLEDGGKFMARAVILTTGTYLKSRIIIGKLLREAGPNNQPAALSLSGSLADLGLRLFRFKTGTPARVDKRSIDFSRTVEQPGSQEPLAFSFLTERFDRPSVPCHLTYTNERTHRLIRDNIHLAPMYSGVIEGVGARYCPSIEDKVVRFADRDAHQLFLEPEGLKTNEIYVQGMSTSLPVAVQQQFLRTIAGLEQVQIMRPAYAIEYDGVVPTQLSLTLEYKDLPGLYGAGQINGTSGYEEAAGQGLYAGINAALALKGEAPFLLKRSEAYLGVLVDDLVNKGTNEPYRLFTSRAEYRLFLRHDNGDLRLTEKGRRIGLVSDERWRVFQDKVRDMEALRRWLKRSRFSGKEEAVASRLAAGGIAPFTDTLKGEELLKRPDVSLGALLSLDEAAGPWREQAVAQVELELKYEGYLKKQREQIARFEKLEAKALPPDLDYRQVLGLRIEAAQKLAEMRPLSIGQASRISGVSPADVNVLLIHLEQERRKQAQNGNEGNGGNESNEGNAGKG